MSQGLVAVSYIASSILFILSLSGLSNQETAKRGNYYGMMAMAIAISATVMSNAVSNYTILIISLLIGGLIGARAAFKVEMTQMPELVALMHSLVGMAAILVGYSTFIDSTSMQMPLGIEKTIHEVEIYIGILIGAITFSGSIIAFGKLCGKINGRSVLLPGRHWLNLGLLLTIIWLASKFLAETETGNGFVPLIIMTIIALIFGIHLVLAIGGADMPIVVSMLNSYSGWAAAATGFMLSNDLLIVTGALVGSSGAILSYIMCRAMNRNFISVIAGGFGNTGGEIKKVEGEVKPITVIESTQMLSKAESIMIIPGYGMAVAQAQHTINEIRDLLHRRGKEIGFGIHPVAGRMPGHMNVLLAEAKIPYDIVYEMEEINDDFPEVDVTLVIGANDIVNPSALDDPNSPIAGMPVLECWKSNATIVLKRSMASGYAGIANPLFVHENTKMLFGDANESLQSLLEELRGM